MHQIKRYHHGLTEVVSNFGKLAGVQERIIGAHPEH
jgi:hypothetical protein